MSGDIGAINVNGSVGCRDGRAVGLFEYHMTAQLTCLRESRRCA
jgi:hypothetical protein